MVYIRGAQVRFMILPDILQKAPFFNRVKLWRQYKGNAVFGASSVLAAKAPPGNNAMNQKSNNMNNNRGPSGGDRGGPSFSGRR